MSKSGYHTIDVTDHDLQRLTNEALEALYASNSPLKLFRYGSQIVRIERSDQGYPVLLEVTEDRMRHRLAEVAIWQRSGARGELYSVFPPVAVVRNVLATPNIQLPVLEQLVESPIFAPDGTLLDRPRYYACGCVACVPPASFQLRRVCENPGQAEIEEARCLLLEDLLGDFPFVGDPDRAHALAALLLPFARLLIDGPTPLHLIDKPAPGTGATLLAQSLAYPALGREVPIMTEAKDEEEWRRRLLAKLLSGGRVVLIDNISRLLTSGALSGAITSSVFEDRLIRTSEIVRAPVRCLWLATGNNTALSNDLARRAVRTRLDARVDKPWLRAGFRHSDLPAWTRENHNKLVWAAITLIRAWLAAGMPSGSKRLGMFESWSRVMGGVLELAGVEGFLIGLDKAYEETDEETRFWAAFTADWWAKYQGTVVTTAELLPLTGELFLDDDDQKSLKIKLGKQVRRMRDRQFNGMRIVQAGMRNGSQLWQLVRSEGK